MREENYLHKMERNIKVAYIKSFFSSLYFFYTTWYAFETQFATPATLGAIYSFTHLVTVVLELPTGALADLIGRKKTVTLGMILQGVGWMYISQAKDASWFWIGYTVGAVGIALSSGADTALDYDSLKELGKEKSFSMFSTKNRIIHRIAMILGIATGGYIYRISQPLPYLLTGAAIVFSGLLTLFSTEPKIDSEKFNLKNYIKQTKDGFKQLFKTEYIRDFSIYYMLVGGITWYFMYFLGQAFTTEIGFTEIERSWLFTGVYILGELIMFSLIKKKKLTRKIVYIMFPVAMIIGFLPGYWVSKFWAVVIVFFAQIIGSARFTILDQYSNQEFESKYRATAISALNMAVSLVFVVVTTVAGKFIEEYGTRTIMTALGVLTIIVVLPLAKILVTNHKDRE